MKKKYSILGLTLTAFSSLTAAFIPSQRPHATATGQPIGHLTQSTNLQMDLTCRAPRGGDLWNCQWTRTCRGNYLWDCSSTSENVILSDSVSFIQGDITLSGTSDLFS